MSHIHSFFWGPIHLSWMATVWRCRMWRPNEVEKIVSLYQLKAFKGLIIINSAIQYFLSTTMVFQDSPCQIRWSMSHQFGSWLENWRQYKTNAICSYTSGVTSMRQQQQRIKSGTQLVQASHLSPTSLSQCHSSIKHWSVINEWTPSCLLRKTGLHFHFKYHLRLLSMSYHVTNLNMHHEGPFTPSFYQSTSEQEEIGEKKIQAC